MMIISLKEAAIKEDNRKESRPRIIFLIIQDLQEHLKVDEPTSLILKPL